VDLSPDQFEAAKNLAAQRMKEREVGFNHFEAMDEDSDDCDQFKPTGTYRANEEDSFFLNWSADVKGACANLVSSITSNSKLTNGISTIEGSSSLDMNGLTTNC
jgi:hypothetical protein